MSMQREKPKMTRSLARTLTLAFLGLTWAALLIAYVPQLYLYVQQGNRAISSEQQLIAQDAANTVADFFRVRFDVLETTARLGDFTLASRQDKEKTLSSLLGLQSAFRQLAFLDAQGQEQVKVSRLSQIASGRLADRIAGDWLAQLERGERYISPVYVDELTSEPLVIVAVPVQDVFGDFQGVLLADVSLKFMWDLVDRLKIGEAGQAYVVDKQGDLIAIGDTSRVLRGENVSHLSLIAEFINAAMPAGQGVTRWLQGIDASWVVGTYVSLGVPDWAVVTELPVQEVVGPLVRSILISLVTTLLIAALVAGVAGYAARRLAAPLLNLTTTAAEISGGKLDLQASLEGPTEVVDLAHAFNQMTAQLRETLAGLEQRVAERTQGLLTAAEVSSATTAVLDIEQLLPQVVELVRERFDLYYVGLFLTDEAGEYAVLRAGSGEAGRAMLERQHRLPIGSSSMIGRCILTGQADIQLDVGEAAVRFSSPDLPDTRSELALPLRAGDQVVGAMTVQSEHEAYFSQEDITVMQTVADQVANAVRNAQLFQQVQASLDAERRAYGELSSGAWRNLLRLSSELGFVSDGQNTVKRVDVWRSEMKTALHTGQVAFSQGDASSLAMPIKVRDQVIGVIDGRKPDGSAWTPEEIDLLAALTDQLNVALESARLYLETQRAAARERTIGEATGRIRESLDIEAVLKTTANEIRQALDLDTLVIRLATPETDDVSGLA
ncbi:MAG: GAF domain-containing protein [Anaerolineae bacterium]|nr:GAF domain-containing protein [Anaerolineae bacterium]